MAERWPFDEWKRNLTDVLNFTSAAAASLGLPQPGLLHGDPFTVIVDTARNWLIGKQRTFTFAGHELTLVLEDLSVEGSDLAKAVGQYGQLSILARDVEWCDYRFEWVEVQARNVHLRPGTKPMLVAAPILCEAFLSAQVGVSGANEYRVKPLALVSTVAPPTLAVFSVLAVDAGAPVWAGLELAGADELPELPHPAAITPATAIPAGASHFLFIAVSIRCGILRYLDRVLPAAGWWLTLRGAPAPGRSPGSGGRMRRRSPGCLPAARARMPGTTWPARRQWSSLLLWLPARAC